MFILQLLCDWSFVKKRWMDQRKQTRIPGENPIQLVPPKKKNDVPYHQMKTMLPLTGVESSRNRIVVYVEQCCQRTHVNLTLIEGIRRAHLQGAFFSQSCLTLFKKKEEMYIMGDQVRYSLINICVQNRRWIGMLSHISADSSAVWIVCTDYCLLMIRDETDVRMSSFLGQ